MERSGFGWRVREQLVAGEARVAEAALGVQDPELRGPAGRPEPIAGHGHLRGLADHVTTEPDPVSPRELQAKAGSLGHGHAQPLSDARRLQDDQQRAGSSREGGQAAEAVPGLDAVRGRVTGLG